MAGRPSVLIVDDDPFVRRLIATTIEDVIGFELHQAADGIEAIEQARRLSPALVFLDVHMPRLDGLEACRALRADPATAGATLVVLTAAGPEAEAAGRAAGADHFLTKPFSPLDLLALLEELRPGGEALPRPGRRFDRPPSPQRPTGRRDRR